MATVILYPTDDGFLNNISGWYPSEGWLTAKSTSSSNTDECEAYMKFTTVGAGIGAGDTINSVTFHWNIYTWNDINFVAYWVFCLDKDNVWDAGGYTWGESFPPYLPYGIGYGTLNVGGITLGSTGWNSLVLSSTAIPKSGIFGLGIQAQLGSNGPSAMFFYDKDTGATSPYIVVDYTPASTSVPLRTMTGCGL